MTIRCRPMQLNDVRECVHIVAAHPILGPRYGSAIVDLRAAWSPQSNRPITGEELQVKFLRDSEENSLSD